MNINFLVKTCFSFNFKVFICEQSVLNSTERPGDGVCSATADSSVRHSSYINTCKLLDLAATSLTRMSSGQQASRRTTTRPAIKTRRTNQTVMIFAIQKAVQ
jgi:hypothetical protein